MLDLRSTKHARHTFMTFNTAHLVLNESNHFLSNYLGVVLEAWHYKVRRAVSNYGRYLVVWNSFTIKTRSSDSVNLPKSLWRSISIKNEAPTCTLNYFKSTSMCLTFYMPSRLTISTWLEHLRNHSKNLTILLNLECWDPEDGLRLKRNKFLNTLTQMMLYPREKMGLKLLYDRLLHVRNNGDDDHDTTKFVI